MHRSFLVRSGCAWRCASMRGSRRRTPRGWTRGLLSRRVCLGVLAASVPVVFPPGFPSHPLLLVPCLRGPLRHPPCARLRAPPCLRFLLCPLPSALLPSSRGFAASRRLLSAWVNGLRVGVVIELNRVCVGVVAGWVSLSPAPAPRTAGVEGGGRRPPRGGRIYGASRHCVAAAMSRGKLESAASHCASEPKCTGADISSVPLRRK